MPDSGDHPHRLLWPLPSQHSLDSRLCEWWQRILDAARCVQVAVPDADMEELLPAARLLSRATAVTSGDYEQAKGVFLQGLQNAGAQAEVRPRRPVLRL